jgi:hypothetical protein
MSLVEEAVMLPPSVVEAAAAAVGVEQKRALKKK